MDLPVRESAIILQEPAEQNAISAIASNNLSGPVPPVGCASVPRALQEGSIPALVPGAGREFSREELGQFDGRLSDRVYVGLLGRVYDVTPASKLYGPGRSAGYSVRYGGIRCL